ncbi:phage head spike fiber domain-containing protein, partial [Roseospira marina]
LWDGAAFQAVGPDVPRIEAGALLIEGAATNGAYHSADTWILSSSFGTVTKSDDFGVGAWATLTTNEDRNAQLLGAASGMIVGEIYTFSCYARAKTHDDIFIQGRQKTSYPKATFDLANGMVAEEKKEYKSVIKNMKNDIYRCSITFVADTAKFYILTIGFVAEAGSSVDIYGRQLERGSHPTSLIATGEGAATRAVDELTYTPATDGTVRLVGTDVDGAVYSTAVPRIELLTSGMQWTAPAGLWSNIWAEMT